MLQGSPFSVCKPSSSHARQSCCRTPRAHRCAACKGSRQSQTWSRIRAPNRAGVVSNKDSVHDEGTNVAAAIIKAHLLVNGGTFLSQGGKNRHRPEIFTVGRGNKWVCVRMSSPHCAARYMFVESQQERIGRCDIAGHRADGMQGEGSVRTCRPSWRLVDIWSIERPPRKTGHPANVISSREVGTAAAAWAHTIRIVQDKQ